jgi:hypothetical protein
MHRLFTVPPEKLAEVDIAEMNLLCAEDLPGAEHIDVDRCLAKLDEWASKVRFETDRHFYRVIDPRYADHYHHSASYYRAEMLLQTLQEDCGVKYNPQRIRDVDFANSKDLFAHGMIDDTNGGTCASMPVRIVGKDTPVASWTIPTPPQPSCLASTAHQSRLVRSVNEDDISRNSS